MDAQYSVVHFFAYAVGVNLKRYARAFCMVKCIGRQKKKIFNRICKAIRILDGTRGNHDDPSLRAFVLSNI
jgi:hypothetical protein